MNENYVIIHLINIMKNKTIEHSSRMRTATCQPYVFFVAHHYMSILVVGVGPEVNRSPVMATHLSIGEGEG